MITNDKAVVYHGTSFERARLIIKDQRIKVTSDCNLKYPNSRKNVVHVTKRLCDALDFSYRDPYAKCECFIVFEIIISKSELSPDRQEMQLKTTLSEGGEKDCYVISRDLLFGEDVKRVFYRREPDPIKAGAFMQSIQYGELEIAESKWREVWQGL